MKYLIAFLIVAISAALAWSFSGLRANGQGLVLQAPDGHCASPMLQNNNQVVWETVECP